MRKKVLNGLLCIISQKIPWEPASLLKHVAFSFHCVAYSVIMLFVLTFEPFHSHRWLVLTDQIFGLIITCCHHMDLENIFFGFENLTSLKLT